MFIGETGRNLKTRLTINTNEQKEWWYQESHFWTPSTNKTKNQLGLCWMHITYSINYQQRLTLESWYTNSEQEPLNRCHQLPAPYKRLIHDLKGKWHTSTNNRQIANNSKTNYCKFHVLTTNQLTNLNHDQRHNYHHLTMTLHLTLKMTTAQVVETSVTNNSLSKDYPHPDDHTKQITDTPEFKPFTTEMIVVVSF